MYPTFSDFLFDLFGIKIPLPIQTFGLFMGLAFIVAAWLWGKELTRLTILHNIKPSYRKEIVGLPATSFELFLNGFLGFVFGYKLIFIIQNYTMFVSDPPSTLLSAKGSLFGGLFVGALATYYKFYSSYKLKLAKPIEKTIEITAAEHVGNMTFIAAIFGILGAKIFHNLENINDFAQDPIGSLLSFSGLTWYGGLICATAALYFYSKKHKLYFPYLMDSSAPSLMIGYAIGRFGCHFSGDGDWGIINETTKPNYLQFMPDWLWAYKYPHNVINEGIPIIGCQGQHCMQLANAVFPTPLYEAIVCTLLFFVLWYLRKNTKIVGLLFSIYLIFNGIERFAVELIRVNTTYDILGGITQAQIISTLIFITGLISSIIVVSKFNQNKKAIINS